MNVQLKFRRIGIWSAVKVGSTISGIMGLILGIIWGIVFAFFSSLINMMMSRQSPGTGVSLIIIMPVLLMAAFGLLGMLVSFLSALLYNLAAGVMGGLELDVEHSERVEEKEEIVNIYEVP